MTNHDPDEALNRMYGVDHAEFVKPSDADPARPPETCEQCGSRDIAPRRKLVQFGAITALVVGIGVANDTTLGAFLGVIAIAIFSLIAPRWMCHQCGYRW